MDVRAVTRGVVASGRMIGRRIGRITVTAGCGRPRLLAVRARLLIRAGDVLDPPRRARPRRARAHRRRLGGGVGQRRGVGAGRRIAGYVVGVLRPAGQDAGGAAGQVGELDAVLALRVRHVGDQAGVAEHLRQPDAGARPVGDGAGRAVAVGEPVQAAADADRAGTAGGVHGEAVEVGGGGHLVGAAAAARAAEAEVQPSRRRVGAEVVDHPQVARALVDDPLPVGGRAAGVEVGVVGVAAQVGAVGTAGVEIADALVVGEEGDPAGDEHRARQMALQVGDQALAVQPQAAGRAAPVALPGVRLVRRGAGQQQGAALAAVVLDGDVGDRPPRQRTAGTSFGGNAVRPGVIGERLTVRRHGQHMTVRRPGAHPGVGAAPVRQPPGGAAVRRDEVHLGVEAAPGGEGDGPAVG